MLYALLQMAFLNMLNFMAAEALINVSHMDTSIHAHAIYKRNNRNLIYFLWQILKLSFRCLYQIHFDNSTIWHLILNFKYIVSGLLNDVANYHELICKSWLEFIVECFNGFWANSFPIGLELDCCSSIDNKISCL